MFSPCRIFFIPMSLPSFINLVSLFYPSNCNKYSRTISNITRDDRNKDVFQGFLQAIKIHVTVLASTVYPDSAPMASPRYCVEPYCAPPCTHVGWSFRQALSWTPHNKRYPFKRGGQCHQDALEPTKPSVWKTPSRLESPALWRSDASCERKTKSEGGKIPNNALPVEPSFAHSILAYSRKNVHDSRKKKHFIWVSMHLTRKY